MSAIEDTLADHIQMARLPTPVREFRAIKGRRFRWDFAWPDQGLLLEVQGGIWHKGGHTSGVGITRDCQKNNLATLAGWDQLTVTSGQITSGQALRWLQEYFSMRGKP